MRESELAHLLDDLGQAHLVGHLDLLPEPVRSRFLDQLLAQDWERVHRMHDRSGPHRSHQVPSDLSPVRAVEPEAEERARLGERGLALLSKGKCAFVLMAGGQGSRLGFEGPKGVAPIGLANDWPLFEVISRRLLRLKQLSGRQPWFGIMTSPENHEATASWFARRGEPHLTWGTPRLFPQTIAPALDQKGRALLSRPAHLAMVPDGNGGIWEAMETSGILDALEQDGVEWIHVAGVDNLLLLPADPVFLGMAEESGLRQASKTVLRTNPAEKVGVFARTPEGATRVAEYTELPPEDAAALDSDHLPCHREANIASHLVRLDLAREYAHLDLPWHLARKSVPHVDALTGKDCSADLACKYERFLFDAFPHGGPMALLRVQRSTEFAPIKNASGADSPESASRALLAMHRHWRDMWARHGERSDSRDPQSPLIDPLESYFGEPPRSPSRHG